MRFYYVSAQGYFRFRNNFHSNGDFESFKLRSHLGCENFTV